MVEEDCKAYRQEEGNMACCQHIVEVEEEDKVGIDTAAVVASSLFDHQEFDSYCWIHHYLILHWLGIGLALDSFEMEDDTENSMEESSSSDQTVS